MDNHQRLAFKGEFSVAVVGRAGEFVLIPLDREVDPAVAEEATTRGFGYCGVVGIVGGQTAMECQPDPDSVFTMRHAGFAFAQFVVDWLRAKPREDGDWLEFMGRLWSLQDPRPER